MYGKEHLEVKSKERSKVRYVYNIKKKPYKAYSKYGGEYF